MDAGRVVNAAEVALRAAWEAWPAREVVAKRVVSDVDAILTLGPGLVEESLGCRSDHEIVVEAVRMLPASSVEHSPDLVRVLAMLAARGWQHLAAADYRLEAEDAEAVVGALEELLQTDACGGPVRDSDVARAGVLESVARKVAS